MCIAAPAHVVEINREDKILVADFGGARQQAKIDLLPEVELGDYVLIHAGYAIEKLTDNDMLLILGKGHEEVIIIGDKKIPFNDHKAVIEILNNIKISV